MQEINWLTKFWFFFASTFGKVWRFFSLSYSKHKCLLTPPITYGGHRGWGGGCWELTTTNLILIGIHNLLRNIIGLFGGTSPPKFGPLENLMISKFLKFSVHTLILPNTFIVKQVRTIKIRMFAKGYNSKYQMLADRQTFLWKTKKSHYF